MSSVLKLPAAQGAHARSVLGSPAWRTKWPGGQVLHGLQALRLLPALKLPAAQLRHSRSSLGLPALLTNWPVEHKVCDTQLVAALASWSQVPGAHGTLGALLPAQYVPASHSSHVGSRLASPGTTSRLPGRHASEAVQLDWLACSLNAPCAHGSHARSVVFDGVLVT